VGKLAVLVCGTRGLTGLGTVERYAWRERTRRALDALHEPVASVEVVLHGCAKGPDTWGGEWAAERGVKVASDPVTSPEWAAYGNGAGHKRNARLARRGDWYASLGLEVVVVAVWDLKSSGTAGMVALAERRGWRVVLVEPLGVPPAVGDAAV
jgi:hypothetical protein